MINAYTLLFGGFLLLGGRMADLLGPRRVFIAGLLLFGTTSLIAGLSSFAHGRDRNIAMGVWGGLAGLGGTLGVVAGGVLVDSLSWQWVFFVNMPIVIALVAVIPVFVRDTRHGQTGDRAFDTAGAVLGTAGPLAVVYGVVRAEPKGWGSAEVPGFLIGGLVLLGAFVAVEARSKAPLVPLRLFRSRALSVSSGSLALNGAGFLSMFFLTAIYLQQVRGDSALEAGVHFLPMGGAAIIGAVLASQLVQSLGTRTVQLVAAAFAVVNVLITLGTPQLQPDSERIAEAAVAA